jgi:hypothetical protein
MDDAFYRRHSRCCPWQDNRREHNAVGYIVSGCSSICIYRSGFGVIDVIEFLWICRAIGADPVRILQALQRGGSHL